MSKNSCHVYLVRHGETDWNKEKRLQGSMDIPLNHEGKAQARILQKQFETIPFSAVYSSDLIRTKETAEIISSGKNLNLITNTSLRERSWGAHEGKSFDELRLKYGALFEPVIEDFEHEKEDVHPDLIQVESYSKAIHRVFPALIKIGTESKGKSVLVVSHGGILKGILLYLNQQEFKHHYVGNTAYLHLEVLENGLVLKGHQGVIKKAR